MVFTPRGRPLEFLYSAWLMVLTSVLTLLVLILEYFYMFVTASAQTTFQVTGLYYSREVSSAVQIIAVVLNATEATFYYSVMKFFWNKWFDGERNLLINGNV